MYNHEHYWKVPERTLNSLDNWAKKGWDGGSFVMACLENDFTRAVGCADKENSGALPGIAKYMYNELPLRCWGSPKIISQWANIIEEE